MLFGILSPMYNSAIGYGILFKFLQQGVQVGVGIIFDS